MQKIYGSYHSYSYGRFKNEVFALGEALTARGFAGSRVMVLGENSYFWCLSYMTVVCGLGTVIPTDKELPEEEVGNIATVGEASLILYSKKYEHKLRQLPEQVQAICFDDLPEIIAEGRERLYEGKDEYASLSIDIDAMCVLIFTSGTTGIAKGVMLSQRNLCHTVRNLVRLWLYEERARRTSPGSHFSLRLRREKTYIVHFSGCCACY